MQDSKTIRKTQGFTLFELMIVLSVTLILGAISVPAMMASFNDIKLRYTASNLSGLLQSARIQAVRKNTFYSVQAGVQAGSNIYYIDKPTAAYAAGDTLLPIDPAVTITQGSTTTAPNAAAFIAGLNFTVDPAADPPSFSARGLPCIGTLTACNPVAGQGFVMFMSRAGLAGNIPWLAVVVNPSAHIQIWSCDSTGTWIQRD
ncbi:MAG TPA: GspH/FimT family pseudopilin [Candidatus Sulfotelmatobacter sp.]|jgi:prepilin-type N-terminal cleavage/methylation domain-containing protein|nr:GspH/FimT family pseudopilin [Candidatus Sulfotelmatobacter sp.]